MGRIDQRVGIRLGRVTVFTNISRSGRVGSSFCKYISFVYEVIWPITADWVGSDQDIFLLTTGGVGSSPVFVSGVRKNGPMRNSV